MGSSSGYLPNPVIELRGSRRIRLFIGAVVLPALCAIAQSRLSPLFLVLAVGLVLAYGGWELRRFGPGSRSHPGQLQVTPDGRLRCSLGRDPTSLIPATVLHWWIACGHVAGLVVRTGDGRRAHAILFRDQLPADQWRKLCACLRLGGAC